MATIIPGLNTGAPDATVSSARGPFNQTLAPESAGLPQPSLHPVEQPENYFVRPPQIAAAQEQVTRNVQQIAGALQSFQPALASYAQSEQTLQQVQAEVAGKAIPAGATPDQIHQIVASTPALQTLAGQRVASGYAGNNAGQIVAQQLDQALHDPQQFNPLKDDPNAFAQKFIAGASANMDQFGKAGLNQAIEPVLARYRNEQSQTIATNNQQTLTNSVTNFASSTFERILADNSIPADKKASTFWTTWNQQARTNKTLFGMTFGQQQTLLSDMLKRAGDQTWTDSNFAGRAQMINDVAHFDRGNGYGTLADSLAGGAASNAVTTASAVADRRTAMSDTDGLAKLHEMAITGDPGFLKAWKDYAATPQGARAARAGVYQGLLFRWQYTSGAQKTAQAIQANNRLADQNLSDAKLAAQQAVLDGDSNSIKPYTDQRWTMKDGIPQQATTSKSAADMKIGAVTDLQANIDAGVKAGKITPEQAQADENHIWMDSGTENPTWKTNLQAGFTGASTMTEGGRPSPNTLQAFQLYQRLQAYSDTYAGSLMSPKAETFYRLAQSAKDIGYNDDASALSAAYKAITSGREALKMPVTQALPNPMAVDQKIRSYLPGGWFGGENLSGADGSTAIVNRIRDDAAMLANGNGLDPADAIAAVAPKVIAQYRNINGSAINIGSAMVPPNFPQLAQKVIDNYWSAHGAELEKEGMSKADLTIRQLNGTPNWGLVFKKSGFQPPGNTSFSVSDLGPVQQQLHAESRAAAEKAAAAEQAADKVRAEIPIPNVFDAAGHLARPVLVPMGRAFRNSTTLPSADLNGP